MSERRMAVSIAARLDRLESARDREVVPSATVTNAIDVRSVPIDQQARPRAQPLPDRRRSTERPPSEGAARPTVEAHPRPSGSVICRVCGTTNEPGDQFCVSCGTFLEWSAERVAGVTDEATQPAQPNSRPAPRDVRPEITAGPAPETASPAGTVTCRTCGTENLAGRTYCMRCGTALALAAAPAVEAQRSVGRAASATLRPDLESLGDYVTAYVPTWVVSLFLPLWGALIAAEAGGTVFGQPMKLAIAVATGITAGLWVWGEGYRKALAGQSRRRRKRFRPIDALRVGAWEVFAATVAAFAWATAAPSSWASFSSAFWPLATVIIATVVLGVAGNFIAPLEGET